MRAIIDNVRHELAGRIRADRTTFAGLADVCLHAHAPLDIREAAGDFDMLSYKAPWTKQHAELALKSTGLYEAGANVFWLSPFPASATTAECAGDTPAWSAVCALADIFRPSDLDAFAAAPGCLAREKRLLFPTALVVHAPTAEAFLETEFPGSLQLVTGHVALYGWYKAMYEALAAGHASWIGALVQAGLTVTVRATLCASTPELAVLSMRASDEVSTLSKHMSDGFPTFSRKLRLALKSVDGVTKRLEFCVKHNVRYNGAVVYRSLLLAALSYAERTDADTHALLLQLDATHGREVLTGKFSNLSRLFQACGKEYDTAPRMWPGASTPGLVSLVVHYIRFQLEQKDMSPATVTVEWLDKRRDGTPGAIATTLAKAQLVHHARALISDLPDEKHKAELSGLLDRFASYKVYGDAFPSPGDSGSCLVADPFVALRSASSRTGQALLDFFFDLFNGTHDKDVAAMCGKHSGAWGLLSWSAFEGDGGKVWRELSRQLDIHKQTVGVGNDSMPPAASARALQRALSDCPDDDATRAAEVEAERLETWRSAVAIRRKYASASLVQGKTEQDLRTWFEAQRAAYEYTGKVGEFHRVFVFSADTFGEESSEPWLQTQPTKDLKAWLHYLKKVRGPTDVILVFDGRNGSDRRVIAEEFEGFRNACDLWVLYEPLRRAGRKVAWGSDCREVGFLSLPVPRTSLALKTRKSKAAAWAPTTYSNFYQNVPQVPWKALPLLTTADKREVLGVDAVADPPEKLWSSVRGQPLYWAERKPVAFWQDVLLCLDAGFVVDMSPGSGSCARAALRSGIQYVGCCRTQAHVGWLTNIMDREACELIVTSKSPLFEQDLLAMLKKHFQEVLDSQKEQNTAENQKAEEQADEDPTVT